MGKFGDFLKKYIGKNSAPKKTGNIDGDGGNNDTPSNLSENNEGNDSEMEPSIGYGYSPRSSRYLDELEEQGKKEEEKRQEDAKRARDLQISQQNALHQQMLKRGQEKEKTPSPPTESFASFLDRHCPSEAKTKRYRDREQERGRGFEMDR